MATPGRTLDSVSTAVQAEPLGVSATLPVGREALALSRRPQKLRAYAAIDIDR